MKSFIMLFVFSLSLMCYAQQNKSGTYNINEITKFKSLHYKPTTQILKPINLSSTAGLQDTLKYPMLPPFSNFGLFGQDWALQWFKSPAELVIKGLGFYCTDNPNDTPAETKIVRLNWSEAQMIAQQDKLHGYYPADGSIAGITSFLDNPDRTGNWVAIDTTETEPFEHDIWGDNGIGYTFIPDETLHDYQWIDTDVLGYEPILNQGEVFGVAVKNTSTVLDSNRIGFFAGQNIGYPFWKFYANGRLVPGVDKGWWTREYTFDFQVAVDIVSGGMIYFNSITYLNSTLSTEPREVFANIFTDGVPVNIPLISKIYYTTNHGTTWNSNDMEYLGNFDYRGVIPGFSANTNVEYYLEATDTSHGSSHTVISQTISYTVFGPSGANTLVVLNGYNQTDGYPQNYFFGPDIKNGVSYFDHDTWAYGQPPSDLFEHYSNIFEICNGYPEYYLDSLIRPWLATGNNRNYYLEGQEWLGLRYSFVDTNFVTGDFEFDVLGINQSFNDVSYANSTGHELPSKILPQALTLFGQPLLDKFATYVPTPDSIQYDPVYEGNTGDVNWIDGFAVESDVVIDVITESRGIAGVPNVQNLPCAMHRTLPNGNKIFFASYWTLYVNTTLANYHWLGFTNESPAYQALLWFGIPIITDVEQAENNIPKVYSLSQNYPNPFNPVTTIKYTIPNVTLSGVEGSRVILKVYDILGKEIATLVNEKRSAGTYEVEFNVGQDSSPDIASGVYFYRLQAGNYVEIKKMLLLK